MTKIFYSLLLCRNFKGTKDVEWWKYFPRDHLQNSLFIGKTILKMKIWRTYQAFFNLISVRGEPASENVFLKELYQKSPIISQFKGKISNGKKYQGCLPNWVFKTLSRYRKNNLTCDKKWSFC